MDVLVPDTDKDVRLYPAVIGVRASPVPVTHRMSVNTHSLCVEFASPNTEFIPPV